MGRRSGHHVVRINLSEQTDLSDLLGVDLPSTNGSGFGWCDGPFLRALKHGDWILLDEVNLASQSVLEGLNAALDHRGTIYVPELDRTFVLQRAVSRIFATQNPRVTGGGRKGLPKSFLNRFIKVYLDPWTLQDLEAVCCRQYAKEVATVTGFREGIQGLLRVSSLLLKECDGKHPRWKLRTNRRPVGL